MSVKKIGFLVLILTMSPLLQAETIIFSGSMTYTYEVHSKNRELLDSFFEYSNNSNSQQILKREEGKITVRNTCFLTPFYNRVSFPPQGYNKKAELADFLDFYITKSAYIQYKKEGKTIREDTIEKEELTEKEMQIITALAEELSYECKYQFEVVEKIITHLIRTIRYELNASEHPATVLKTRKGDCDGYSNLAMISMI